MRPLSTLIAAGALALVAVAASKAGAPLHPPAWALMTFAVAAFSGPVR